MRWKFTSSIHKRMSSKESMSVLGGHCGDDDVSARLMNGALKDSTAPPWKLSLPHVCVAVISSFLFGYHIGVVNEPLESISFDLGFGGDTIAEGLVVSICLGGAFMGCMFSGWIADGFGRRRAFQLSSLPMIVGASMSASTTSLQGMLLGRFLVGTGMGLGPPIASLYVTEVSPSYLRGTYGSFIQIATCLGLIGAQFMGFPVKRITGWWRLCFWVSVIPAALLILLMEFCVESPHWLFKRGKVTEAEFEFERLLGETHASVAITELSHSVKVDDAEAVTFSELIFGRYCGVVSIGSALFALQQLSGINAIFFFSSSVFKNAGVPSAPANICIGFANLAGSIIAMMMMDRLGRKVLLLGSFLGMVNSPPFFGIVIEVAISLIHHIHVSGGGNGSSGRCIKLSWLYIFIHLWDADVCVGILSGSWSCSGSSAAGDLPQQNSSESHGHLYVRALGSQLPSWAAVLEAAGTAGSTNSLLHVRICLLVCSGLRE